MKYQPPPISLGHSSLTGEFCFSGNLSAVIYGSQRDISLLRSPLYFLPQFVTNWHFFCFFPQVYISKVELWLTDFYWVLRHIHRFQEVLRSNLFISKWTGGGATLQAEALQGVCWPPELVSVSTRVSAFSLPAWLVMLVLVLKCFVGVKNRACAHLRSCYCKGVT